MDSANTNDLTMRRDSRLLKWSDLMGTSPFCNTRRQHIRTYSPSTSSKCASFLSKSGTSLASRQPHHARTQCKRTNRCRSSTDGCLEISTTNTKSGTKGKSCIKSRLPGCTLPANDEESDNLDKRLHLGGVPHQQATSGKHAAPDTVCRSRSS